MSRGVVRRRSSVRSPPALAAKKTSNAWSVALETAPGLDRGVDRVGKIARDVGRARELRQRRARRGHEGRVDDARAVFQKIDVDGAKQRIDADLRQPRPARRPLGFGEALSRDQARMRDHDESGWKLRTTSRNLRVGDAAPRARGTKQRPVSRDVAVAEEIGRDGRCG